MKTSTLSAAVAALALASSAVAQSTLMQFDALGSGDAANLAAPSYLKFNEGTFSPDYDADGDVILGSERWRVAADASPIVVRDPAFYDRGTAPSGSLALDGVFQPTLINFDSRQSLTEFSVTLDNDAFGDPSAQILFYTVGTAGNSLLAILPVNQTVPGFTATLTQPLSDVDMIVLPSGALYDDVRLAVVPEPGTTAMALVGAGVLGVLLVRRNRSVSR
ncbi:MAG: PEP-CTERM sorting domain-containing protein [Verrucomicrobiota bacterium]|jgi:hypothetical protein